LQDLVFSGRIRRMNDRSDSPARATPARARAEIIAVSHRLFLLQGFHGTTMRQIAKNAGVALGSLYNHFADKDDLFSAVFEAYNPYPTLLLALENSRGTSTEELARTAARRMVNVLSARPDLVKLVFIDVVEFQGEHLRAAYPAVAAGMHDFARRLRNEPGTLQPLSEDALLRAFFGLFFTFTIHEMLLGAPTDSESQSAVLQELIEIYLNGILA